MAGAWPELTLRERVLLWLAHVAQRGEDDPAARTQAGLAQATALDRGHVSRTVAPLVAAGLLVEERVHVPGFARTLKAYRLGAPGELEATRLTRTLLAVPVEVRHGANPPVVMGAAEALARLPGKADVWHLVQQMGAQGFVDLAPASAEPVTRGRFLRDLADAPLEGPFVGRARELDQFESWLAGPVPLFVVEGPGGVGKSTLVAHALRKAALRRHVLWLRISEWSTLESLAARVDAHVAELGRTLGATAATDDPEAWAEAVAQRVRRLPVVVVVDDMQKASPLLNAALVALARRLRSAGAVKLAFIGREVGMPSDLARDAERRRLHPLSNEEADLLLAGRGVGRAQRGPMIEAAQGSPLFLELLAQSGEAGRVEKVRADFLHFIGQDLVSDLPRGHLEVLTCIAALRAPVEEAFFRRLGVGSPGVLADLVQASLVKARVDGGYEMHDLVRAAFYDRLSFAERQRLHERLAQAFRPVGRDPTRGDWSGVTEFLHHLVQGGRRDEAVRWVLRNQTPLMARAAALFRSPAPTGENRSAGA